MKNSIKTADSRENLKTEALVRAAMLHILAVVVGIVSARALTADKLLPFGIAFLAGSSLTYTPSAAIGVFAGYFFPALGSGGFRYIAAVFAVLLIKLLLGGYRKIAEGELFCTLIALLASFLTSAVSLGGINFEFLYSLAEAILAAGGAFFVSRLFKGFKTALTGLSADELAALFVVIGILLTGLNGITFNGITLGGVVGTALILTAAKYGGILSACLCSVAVSLSFLLSGVSGEKAVLFSFIGLIAGVFSAMGKYIQVILPVIFGVIGGVVTGEPLIIASIFIETALGSTVFLILPRKLGIYISRIFSVSPKSDLADSLKGSLTMRLVRAASALSEVSKTVEQVSGELSKINSPDFGSVISAIEEDACAGCKLRIHCWEARRDSTVEAILSMTRSVKEGNRSPEAGAPEEFKGRCIRVSGVANAAYRRYSDYTAKIAAENRIDEVRSVVSDQFDGISYMLSELAADLEQDGRLDSITAQKAASALKGLNIHTEKANGRIDKYGRIRLEIKVKKEPELVINKLQVMKLLSVVCERDFDPPSVTEAEGYVFITLSEHAALRVDVGIEQKCASEAAMCGDACKYFFDGRGHFIMILSDGMGTGGRAAVDGAMAAGLMCRLLKAGFGYECSLKMLNSSMLFKSTDESMATVDIVSIDLYTGKTELYKAGAAPTLIRRQGRTGRAESSSLPIGILRDVGFDKAVVRCREGDIVVLMSDGATANGLEWIRDELENWAEGTAEELAECICEGAVRRRTGERQDDVTVITAILKKAV